MFIIINYNSYNNLISDLSVKNFMIIGEQKTTDKQTNKQTNNKQCISQKYSNKNQKDYSMILK